MKNQEKINIWDSINQSEVNCPDNATPVLVFKRNRSKTYAVINLEKLIDLIYESANKSTK